MREMYSFGVYSEDARVALGPESLPARTPQDTSDGFLAKGIVGDPFYLKLQEADRLAARSGKRSLVGGWEIQRTYTSAEIERAQLFLIQMWYAAGAGEEQGTWYTDGVFDKNCTFERERVIAIESSPFRQVFEENPNIRCALSSRQVGPLRFPFRKMRKGRDIFLSWAGELVVSERLGMLIEDGGFTGAAIKPIWNTGSAPKSMPDLSDVPSGLELLRLAIEKGLRPVDRAYWSWLEEDAQLTLLDRALWEQMQLHQSRRAGPSSTGTFAQLIVRSQPLAVWSKTLFGESPFRAGSGEHCKCAYGEVRGKRLLSPLSVIGSSWSGSDICRTDVYVGGKTGLFRPWQLLVISKRLFDAMRQAGMKGYDFEVVEMV